MKTLLALIIATAGLAAAAPEASAGGRCGVRSPIHRPVFHVRKLCTKVVCSRYFTKTTFNHCGQPICIRYKTVTYRDFYSNGTTRTYKRTLRA